MKLNPKNQLPVQQSIVLHTTPPEEKKVQIISPQIDTPYALSMHQVEQTVNDFQVPNTADDIGVDEFFSGGADRVSAPQPYTSSQKNPGVPVVFLPSRQDWRFPVPIALAGGAAIAASVGGLAYLETSHSQFEGQIQLLPKTSDSFNDTTLPLDNVGNASISVPETIAIPPTRISGQTGFLDSTVLPLALEQVNAQGINLSQAQLAKNTDLHWNKTGILEISYWANDASEVNYVLRAIAQTYQSQTGVCQSQACLNAQYIQIQISHKEQELARLQDNLIAFQQQYQLKDIDRYQQDLEEKGHKFTRVRDQLERELLTAQAELKQQQDALGLPQNSDSALMLLKEAPRYQAILKEWKHVDQQLIGSLAENRNEVRQAELTQQYEKLSTQLFLEIQQISQGLPLHEMPPDLSHAIVQRPQRLESVKAWLNQTQRVQLLTIRNEHLAQVAHQLDMQIQQLRSLLVQHDKIIDNIKVARQTLTSYRERYAVIQKQVLPQLIGWQLVAPPEVIQTNPPLRSVQQWITQQFEKASYAQIPKYIIDTP